MRKTRTLLKKIKEKKKYLNDNFKTILSFILFFISLFFLKAYFLYFFRTTIFIQVCFLGLFKDILSLCFSFSSSCLERKFLDFCIPLVCLSVF